MSSDAVQRVVDLVTELRRVLDEPMACGDCGWEGATGDVVDVAREIARCPECLGRDGLREPGVSSS